MRLLHMADAHYGRRFSSSRFGPEAAAARRRALEEALRRMVEYANENAVDAVLCAGDLIESGEIRPSDVRTLTDILSGLKAAMYVVAGNHDPLDALSPYGRLTSGGLTVLPAGYSRTMLDADTALHAFSFPEAVVRVNPLEKTPLDMRAKRNLLLLHCDAISPESDYLPARMAFLRQFDYCALGHVHQPLELAPGVRYAGSLLGMDRNETGPRGFVVLNLDDDPAGRFVPLPLPTYETAAVGLSAQDGGAEARILRALDQLPKDSLVSVTLTGTHPAGARPDVEALTERLRAAGRQTYLIDQTRPAYDLPALAAEHRDDLLGQVIAAFGPEDEMRLTDQLALEYALTALMEGGRRA